MALKIERTVYLGILDRQDESLQLPDDCEPLILDEQSVSLHDLIEDEVLLAMPISPMHETDECTAAELLESINSKNTNNPFSILQTLVNKPGKQQEN